MSQKRILAFKRFVGRSSSRHRVLLLWLFLVTSLIFNFNFVPIGYAAVVRDIQFPINGAYEPFTDSFGDPRSGGRTHEGIDILGEKMTPLVSVVDGQVTFAPIEEPFWGYALHIRDDEGWEYRYLHLNNDTPGTDDNQGGFTYAFAPGIERGVRVTRGQLVAFMGDSGNAEAVTSHLHFEMREPDGAPINPYFSLQTALQGSAYVPELIRQESPTINEDKNLIDNPSPACSSGSLVKSDDITAVYYCGADGQRYVFPNDKTYFTWYEDFGEVVLLTPEELASLPLGGNVTYRPGVKLVKITTDPKVYAVSQNGVLRWVTSSTIAAELYGDNWAAQVDDMPDAFFTNYTIGEPINSSS